MMRIKNILMWLVLFPEHCYQHCDISILLRCIFKWAVNATSLSKFTSLLNLTFFFQPEAVYQSTTVVQHFSCCAVAPLWRYPLSLAQHLFMTFSQPDDVRAEEQSFLTQLAVEERRSHLPQALPLTCPSPQWHRWWYKCWQNKSFTEYCLTLLLTHMSFLYFQGGGLQTYF